MHFCLQSFSFLEGVLRLYNQDNSSASSKPDISSLEKADWMLSLLSIYIDLLSIYCRTSADTQIACRTRASFVALASYNSGTPPLPRDESCLLYTSDAADDTPCVDLGGRRIIKKKNKRQNRQHGQNEISKEMPS
eukprot:TRINITY_DN10029_c0_g1_i3.p3 TRINITY_DN10029_c0_g1~~TRINITY_DN10029_c0_g1_i3.p3  ORF type:complete len:135 (+),score=7.49 TRINITY_DN10029_c0_g1_i3:481-885(+)